MPDQDAPLPFPEKGIDVTKPFGEQPPLTTPEGTNTRFWEAKGQRGRGGSRSGLSRYPSDRVPAGTTRIQELNVIVTTREIPRVALLFYTTPTEPVIEALVAQYDAVGFIADVIDFTTDLTPYTLLILSEGVVCDFYDLAYANASFNARVKTYLEGGGRVYTHGEHYTIYGEGTTDICMQLTPLTYHDYAIFPINIWLAALGASMQHGIGSLLTNDGTNHFHPPDTPAQPAAWEGGATALSSSLYGSRSGVIYGGTPLYLSIAPYGDGASGYGIDLNFPSNRHVLAAQKIVGGYLFVGGDSNFFPGLTGAHKVTDAIDPSLLNFDFWTNLALYTDDELDDALGL